ncbi:MAG TPA: excinuclease ABC subunit UvrA [Phycisphaerae bacterium]|nr:excinuclease ABC subunit UvrA [Phycisphaerae bacterium]
MDTKSIIVKGAREHNLRGVSLELPQNKLICFTGVSGSGKSSLAFDTLFAEGQRRYIESLSAYARQFLGQLPKPDVDLISGLSPTISIQQQSSGWNPRSTVGTVTQIHDFLRVLFARLGRQHCPTCGKPITAQTREQIVARIQSIGRGQNVIVLAPVVRGQKGEFRDLFSDMLKRGYARARVDGKIVRLADDPMLDRNIRHSIEVVVDRIKLSATDRSRLHDAVEQGLALGDGSIVVQTEEGNAGSKTSSSQDVVLSAKYACTTCDRSFEPPTPQMFSFNSPSGMCTACDGLGERFDFDPELLVPNPKKSFLKLAVEPMRTRIGRWRRHIYRGVADAVGFDLDKPWKDLPQKARDALLFGTGDLHVTYTWRTRGGVWKHGGEFEGVIADLRSKYRKAKSAFVRAYYEKYMRRKACDRCDGARLNPQARSVLIGGQTLPQVSTMTIGEAADFFAKLKLTELEQFIAEDVLKEINHRLGFLVDVGLHYLTLDRTAPTLSGGESQRIRLASQIGAGLVGVLYILDEPSIGLHAKDNTRLLASLERLRDAGNTVIVVEHDEETMRAADVLVDFGPGPGVRGGEVVACGSVADVIKNPRSITGQFLSGKEEIAVPKNRRPVGKEPEVAAPKKRAKKTPPKKAAPKKNTKKVRAKAR